MCGTGWRRSGCVSAICRGVAGAAIDDRIYQLEGQKDLEIARYYYRAGKKYASSYYYKRVIANWPDTTFAETARKELAARMPGGRPMKRQLPMSKGQGPIANGQWPRCCLALPARVFVVLLAALAIWSCGYSTRPLYDPAYRTVAVPIFDNKSFRREWEFRLTEAIAENIEARTPYKIAPREKADTILTGEIVDDVENVLTRRLGTNLPRESQFTVLVNFTWKDRSGRVLVERKDFNRSATEIPQLGERAEDAEQMAIERLAAAIVDQMQTEW